MKIHFSTGHIRAAIVYIGLLFCGWALMAWPQVTANAMAEGLSLCAGAVIPSLFPFLVLSSCVVELGMARQLGRLLSPVARRLLRLTPSGTGALVLGYLGGYPVGARTVVQMYQSGHITRDEGQRLLAFCSNCGPAFLLGMVGSGIFASPGLGLVLLLTHVLASLFIALLFRPARTVPFRENPHQNAAEKPSFSSALSRSVMQAMQAIINICAFVLTFTVLICLLDHSRLLPRIAALLASPAGLPQESVRRLLVGILEMTSGVTSLRSGPVAPRLVTAAFFLGWGGLCVHCQVLSLLEQTDLSARNYWIGKGLHGVLAALLVGVWLRFFPHAAAVFSPGLSPSHFPAIPRTVSLSVFGAWLVWLSFFLFTWIGCKKRSGKMRGSIL